VPKERFDNTIRNAYFIDIERKDKRTSFAYILEKGKEKAYNFPHILSLTMKNIRHFHSF